MIEKENRLNLDGLKRFIKNKRVLYFESCPSTNPIAKAESVETVVVAATQSEGKGRKNRVFSSNKGGVYFSYTAFPNGIEAQKSTLLVLLAGVAVCEVLKTFGKEARLKFPNDVIFGGKKLGGITVDGEIENEYLKKAVIGISVNVASEIDETLKDVAISLCDDAIDLNEFVAKIVEKIDSLLKSGIENTVADYIKYSNTIGKRVEITSSTEKYKGVAVGISECGNLIVERDGGKKTVILEDVTVREEV